MADVTCDYFFVCFLGPLLRMCFFPPHTSPWGTGWPTPGSRAWGTGTEETKDSCSYDKSGQTRRFPLHSFTGKGASGMDPGTVLIPTGEDLGTVLKLTLVDPVAVPLFAVVDPGSVLILTGINPGTMLHVHCTTYRGGSSYLFSYLQGWSSPRNPFFFEGGGGVFFKKKILIGPKWLGFF